MADSQVLTTGPARPLGRAGGAGVQEVPEGSPADDAGLQPGDLIYRVDDVTTPSTTALTSYIRSQTIGGEHEVHFVRDGEQQSATVTLDQESE